MTSTVTAEGEEEMKATAGSPPTDPSEEVPHARGPSVVGVEDLGLQDGKGVELNLSEEAADDTMADASATEPNPAGGESGTTDKDGDIVLDDTTPKEETKAEDTTVAVPQTGDETSTAAGDSVPAVEAEKKE